MLDQLDEDAVVVGFVLGGSVLLVLGFSVSVLCRCDANLCDSGSSSLHRE